MQEWQREKNVPERKYRSEKRERERERERMYEKENRERGERIGFRKVISLHTYTTYCLLEVNACWLRLCFSSTHSLTHTLSHTHSHIRTILYCLSFSSKHTTYSLLQVNAWWSSLPSSLSSSSKIFILSYIKKINIKLKKN